MAWGLCLEDIVSDSQWPGCFRFSMYVGDSKHEYALSLRFVRYETRADFGIVDILDRFVADVQARVM